VAWGLAWAKFFFLPLVHANCPDGPGEKTSLPIIHLWTLLAFWWLFSALSGPLIRLYISAFKP